MMATSVAFNEGLGNMVERDETAFEKNKAADRILVIKRSDGVTEKVVVNHNIIYRAVK